MKHERMQTVITALKRAAIEQERPLWKRVAVDLEKPSRARRIVNLWRLDREAKEGEVIIVPGKVLGDGVVTKKFVVAAAGYSGEAVRKLSAAGAKALSIEELLRQHPDGKKIKIIG